MEGTGCCRMSLEAVEEEPMWANSAESWGVSEAAAHAGLYSEHTIKQELVIGPEVLQPPDALFRPSKQASTSTRALSISDQVPVSSTAEAPPGVATLSERGIVADPDSAVAPSHNTSQTDITNISALAGYQCDGCGKSFRRKSVSKKHIQIHMSSGRLCSARCGVCVFNNSYISNSSLTSQLHRLDVININIKPFQCSQCDYKCGQKSNLRTHQRIHDAEKPFQCIQCNYKCRYKSNLQRHEMIHTKTRLEDTSIKPFQCSQCDYKCRAKSHLLRHQRIHTGEKPFQCNQCDYKCSLKTSLLGHQMIHTGEKPFQCSQCKYKFRKKSNLQVHQRIHTGEKPFHCSQCDYKCKTKSNLVEHQRIHTIEKPFQCSQCDYKCRSKSNLKGHQRIHTKDKPFQCSQCDYRCRAKSNLLQHQMMHTGEKPFQCSVCDYKSRVKANLQRHQKIHTRNGGKTFHCG